MPLISDTNQKKLEKLNINIKTRYIVNKNILERNTDNYTYHGRYNRKEILIIVKMIISKMV